MTEYLRLYMKYMYSLKTKMKCWREGKLQVVTRNEDSLCKHLALLFLICHNNFVHALLDVDGQHFENGAFKNDDVTVFISFSCLSQSCFLKHKSYMTGDCCVFKFLRHSVDEKHFKRFQTEWKCHSNWLWLIVSALLSHLFLQGKVKSSKNSNTTGSSRSRSFAKDCEERVSGTADC